MSNILLEKEVVIDGQYFCPITAPFGLTEEILDKVMASKKFTEYISSISSEFDVHLIHIQSVDMFGPNNVGFIKLKCEAYFNDKLVPGIVFIRGDSVSIFIVLILPNGDRHVLLVVQPRLAIGSIAYPEAVAGMMDNDSGNLIGVAAKEIQEETGLIIAKDQLIPLGEIYPSPGGCDEKINLYAYEKTISEVDFSELQGKATGCIKENEQIVLMTCPYGCSSIIDSTDPKLVISWMRYEQYISRR